MKNKLQKRRTRNSDEWQPPLKMKKVKTYSTTNHSDPLKIVLRKLSSSDYSNTICEKSQNVTPESNKYFHTTWLEPRLFIRRIDAILRESSSTDIESSFRINHHDEMILFGECKKQGTSHIAFSSIQNTSRNTDSGFETVTTSNTVSVRTESLYIPLQDPVQKSSPINVLKDVKNVVATSGRKVLKKLPPSGRENVCKMKRKQAALVESNSNLNEADFARKLKCNNNELIVSLSKLKPIDCLPYHHRIVEKRFVETTSKTEQSFDNRKREVEKKLEIQQTVGIDLRSHDMGLQQNSTEIIRERYTEKVKNVEISATSTKRKSPRVKALKAGPIPSVMTRSRAAQLSNNSQECSQVATERRTFVQIVIPKLNYLVPTIDVVRSNSKAPSTSKNKKLNVSFKEQNDIIENPADMILVSSSSEDESYVPTHSRRNYHKTSTPRITRSRRKRMDQIEKLCDIENDEEFCGFPETTDLSDHSNFCSHVLHSIGSQKKKKRMTKKEALQKTELANLCKKTLENSTRTSQRCKAKKEELAAKTKRFKSGRQLRSQMKVLTPQKTPVIDNKVPIVSSACSSKRKVVLTPYVSLQKLREADISSYKITPLKEDRIPLKPKTAEDYGIDDVNTDDSTDNEDYPKKCIPLWAQQVKANLANCYNPQTYVSQELVRKWMQAPKHRYSLKTVLFK